MEYISLNTLVVGSGAAGLRAAECLHDLGVKDAAIVTESIEAGTSLNTGSDKQTYYKLSLSGSDPDSVRVMAGTLFNGQAVDGDNALCEAAASAGSFYHLAALGVPFPTNAYGEYVGYKTDHDPHRRATGAGPYTSRLMAQVLRRSVVSKGIKIYDRLQAIRLLTHEGRAVGLICLNLGKLENEKERYVCFRAANIVWATGGPADMYLNSVYPISQRGATGVALEAGAAGQNLTEWQFGLSSLAPRWNVSGSYMQALPRVYSTEKDLSDEREFLTGGFETEGEMLTMLFLKGYQWPFDARKALNGSTRIDLLAHREQMRGRRIFLDYTKNPGGGKLDFSLLSNEARSYLEGADACLQTPIERLKQLNLPAFEFYREHGVDLERQPLEIALCVQHNNGGLAVDKNWQTSIRGLYAAGEAAGTHGVYRPGGSALNAGQCGALRAAEAISESKSEMPDEACFIRVLDEAIKALKAKEAAWKRGGTDLEAFYREARADMDMNAGTVRSAEGLRQLKERIDARRAARVRVKDPCELPEAYRMEQTLLTQKVYVEAMQNYLESGGRSRGSTLYTDPKGEKPAGFPEEYR
ncbi:MAG: FAD-binding protein, partial [Clostridia bacterium]|nr:FAD-binding protein [Clostridia bacterium]